ncbi:uncharacterized protein LOC135393200 [Ornithodoros turicata]|uniref:uncharacterized protein LOC135393200 n=1 Tax=Ornithodoros turicata TaxID=34597 RepID=UPI0031395911
MPRETRHLAYIAEFTSRHVTGTNNPVADALGRSVSTVDAVLGHLVQGPIHRFRNRHVPRQLIVWPGHPRPCVARRVQARGLQHFPRTSPPFPSSGLPSRCVRHILCFVPYRRAGDASGHLRALRVAAYEQRHQPSGQGLFPLSTKQSSAPHSPDAFCFSPARSTFRPYTCGSRGPAFTSPGFQILTIIDRYIRWPEAVPLSGSTGPTVAAALLREWVSRFGVPSIITTDRGPQFESVLSSSLTNAFGTRRIRTTAYHPASNGLVERLHRQPKAALRASPETPWPEALPIVLLVIRSAFKPDFECSSAELVYGMALRLLGDLVSPPSTPTALPPPDFVTRLLCALHLPVPTLGVPTNIPTCAALHTFSFALLHPPTPFYTVPHRVLSRAPRYYTVLVNGKGANVNIERLKPAFLDTHPSPEVALSTSSPGPGLPLHQPYAAP